VWQEEAACVFSTAHGHRQHALRRNELFKRVVQSLIELSSNNERSLLESISNHIGAKGAMRDSGPILFDEKQVSHDSSYRGT
jgi:hypothetical protein